jgi:hypothetical protein
MEAADEHLVEDRALVPRGVTRTVKGEVGYPLTRRGRERRRRDPVWCCWKIDSRIVL